MKRLIRVCLLFAWIIFMQNTYAQKPDSANKTIRIRCLASDSNAPAPLYVIDGVIYKGELSSINPGNIKSVDVLKGDSAVALYGPAAKSGVILIKMKHSRADNSLLKVNIPVEIRGNAAVKPEDLYVIDGKQVSDSEYEKLNPNDIFEITLLRDSTSSALYGPVGANGATLITTKKQAQKIYQIKLSAFSDRYRKYMEKHADDSKLLYVLNNTMLQIDKKRLRELYDLAPGDIKKVTFKTDSRFKNDATVVIITNDADSSSN